MINTKRKEKKRNLRLWSPDANYNFEIILQGSLYVVLEIKWIVIYRRQMSL